MAAPLFPVDVRGVTDHAAKRHQVVFHGINKSGSLAMADVLWRAYMRSLRGNQVMSTYFGVPRSIDLLRGIVGSSSGHSLFIAHDLYGSYRRRPRRQVLVTQFRNPLPRARSCHRWLQVQHGLTQSFEEWLVSTGGVHHTQMEQFAIGYGADAPHWSTIGPEEAFERAVANVERDVAWFGLAERFEESIFVLAAMCGLERVPAWRRDDRNLDRPRVDAWAPGEQELVREVMAWDLRFYAWAEDRFEERLAGLDLGPGLEDYRAACRGEYKDRLDARGVPIER